MRLTCVALSLSGLALLAGCSSHRQPPYANDPLLTHYKPTLSDSATIMAEKQARRGPTKPPMPMVGGDAARSEQPTELLPPPGGVQPVKLEQLDVLPPPPNDAGATTPLGVVETPQEPPQPALTLPKRPQVLAPAPRPAPVLAPPESTKPPTTLPNDKAEDTRSLPPPPMSKVETTPLDPPNSLAAVPPMPDKPAPPLQDSLPPPVKDSVTESSTRRDNESAGHLTPPSAALPPSPPMNVEKPSIAVTEPAARRETEKPTAPAPRQRKIVEGNFGFDPDYHWVQGVLDRHFRGYCCLRYCDPSQDDAHGGKVRLQDDDRLSAFQDGDVIGMEGELVTRSEGGAPSPRFVIREVWLVRKKQSPQ